MRGGGSSKYKARTTDAGSVGSYSKMSRKESRRSRKERRRGSRSSAAQSSYGANRYYSSSLAAPPINYMRTFAPIQSPMVPEDDDDEAPNALDDFKKGFAEADRIVEVNIDEEMNGSAQFKNMIKNLAKVGAAAATAYVAPLGSAAQVMAVAQAGDGVFDLMTNTYGRDEKTASRIFESVVNELPGLRERVSKKNRVEVATDLAFFSKFGETKDNETIDNLMKDSKTFRDVAKKYGIVKKDGRYVIKSKQKRGLTEVLRWIGTRKLNEIGQQINTAYENARRPSEGPRAAGGGQGAGNPAQ